MILVFGSINIDLVARVSAIPRPGETVLSTGYEMLFGGKGANQAVAAARASRGTGIEVAMAARVGSDEFGRAAMQRLHDDPGAALEMGRAGRIRAKNHYSESTHLAALLDIYRQVGGRRRRAP